MPDPTRTHREFQPSTNQALAELEEATGKPVLILEEPELNVAATFRRARAGQASHVLRRKSGSDPIADYLITFECRMALREPKSAGTGEGRQAMGERAGIKERVVQEVEELYPQMAPVKAMELGVFMLQGLIPKEKQSNFRGQGPSLESKAGNHPAKGFSAMSNGPDFSQEFKVKVSTELISCGQAHGHGRDDKISSFCSGVVAL